MLSSVGLEVMNSTNPELNWKTVTKGRRSRKSVAARSLNGIAKISNSTSPKRVGDFFGSDSDKAGKVVLEHSTSGKSESVPIKKRRHLLQSGSPHPWTRSLRRQGSPSPQTCASPSFEDQEQLLYSSGQQSSNQQLHKLDRSAKFRSGEALHNLFLDDQTTLEYNDAGDFSGIELLAAAASMDVPDDGSANKQDLVVKDSFIPQESDASGSATPYKAGSENNEPGNSLSPMVLHGVNTNTPPALGNSAAAASQSLSGSPEDDEIMPKVSRQHWDLNTLMDAWGVPYSDSIAANTSKDVHDDMHIEERQKACRDHVCLNPGGTKDGYFNLKIEENKLTAVSLALCSVQLEKPLGEPPSNNPYSSVAGENTFQANTTVVSNFDAHMDTSNQVVITDSILHNSPFTKPSCSFGLLMSTEKMNSMPGPVPEIPDEDCSSNVGEFDVTTVSGRILTRTRDFRALVMPASEIPRSPINFQGKHTKDIQKTTEQHGSIVQDGQLVLTSDSGAQNDGMFASDSTIKHEDNNTPNESTRNMTEDSSKSCSPPTVSVGKIGSTIDGPPNSDVSQNNRFKMVDGDELTGFQEGYDSPYEDGELRGSFLYSWEYNEVENECLDYESDGRNGDDGSDAAGYPGSVIVEVGSEGSHGTVRSSLLVDGFPQGKSNGELAKSSAIGNNEMAGKGSNAGSGTTVEHSLEMLINEDDEGMKGDHLTNRREAVGVKLTRIDEYDLKTAGGKIQNRIEGRSCMDATDGKDAFFIQQCRSRRPSSYSRSEMDISPDKYTFRYRADSHGERDGVHQFMTSWGSRRRYTSSYQGSECRPQTRPRSKHGDFGLDFHDPRQSADYLPNGFHRPFMRRSPIERDDFLGPSRRMPPNRGVGNYRGRGHYSQHGSRNYGGDFEPPLPDDVGPPVRTSRYFSRRDRSFSPSYDRNSRIPLPRRSRSRSRTRSPRAWHPNREQRIFGNNNRRSTDSRSPDFGPEARMERTRMPPFSKPNFASDYGERRYISPQRGCRWVDDRSNSFANNHNIRRRRSPVRVFRRNQRFDAFESSGRLESDEYFRPPGAPSGRFPFMGKGGRECKLESNYDDRRRGDGGEVMQRPPHCDGGGDIRRCRNDAVGDLGKSELNNNEDDDVPRDDVKQSPTDAEGKRAVEV